MNGTLLPEAQIVEEFRRRQKRQIAAVVGIFAIVGLIWGLELAGIRVSEVSGEKAAIVALVIVVVYVVFSLRNWRCPACFGYFGKSLNPSFCSKCGAKLKS